MLMEQLLARGPVITDGAWGTQFQLRGLAAGECADPWNLTRPERVREIASAYVQAGSSIILTNTFNANRIALTRHALAHKTSEINRAGARLSKEAAGGKAHVFASIGPTGLMFLDDTISELDLLTVFREQAVALKEGGADAIVIETMADLTEAKLAVAAAKETNLPVVACMVFDSGARKDRTMTGITPEQAARELETAGADVVGANCGQSIDGYAAIYRQLRAGTRKPVWLKPNAGLPELKDDGTTCYASSSSEFAALAPALLQDGAQFIGGCCGTTPAFIAALRATVDSWQRVLKADMCIRK